MGPFEGHIYDTSVIAAVSIWITATLHLRNGWERERESGHRLGLFVFLCQTELSVRQMKKKSDENDKSTAIPFYYQKKSLSYGGILYLIK